MRHWGIESPPAGDRVDSGSADARWVLRSARTADPTAAPLVSTRGVRMRYAELQVTTHFSFLRGASSAEELFATAAAPGIDALRVVDRNSLAGIVRV